MISEDLFEVQVNHGQRVSLKPFLLIVKTELEHLVHQNGSELVLFNFVIFIF